MTATIHILVMDDRTLIREILVHRLDSQPGFSAEGSHVGEMGIELAQCHKPSAIILHTAASQLDPFSTAVTLTTVSPESKILLMSRSARDVEIEQALRVGAHGYLTEQQSFADAVAAVRAVLAGESWFAPEIRARLLDDPGRPGRLAAGHAVSSALSERERETLIYTARGMSTKEVAHLMHVSSRTVESHVARLLKKLALRDRVALTRYAIRERLVDP